MATSIPNRLTRTGDNELEAWNDGCELTSGDKIGRPAVFDAPSSSYKHTVDIHNSTSFCIKPYTITSGPLKGCRALILVPAGNFRLLDLPREIRNIIYKLLIESNKTIDLVTYNPSLQSKRIVQRSFRREDRSKNKAGYTRTKDPSEPHSTAMSLLLVNRQVYEETVEVVYGANTFSFDRTEILKLFLKINSKCLPTLRSLELDCLYDPRQDKVMFTLKAAQRALWQATGLRKLRIKHHAICMIPSVNAEAFVEAFAPLLKKLQNFKQMKGVNTSVVDLLELPECNCGVCVSRKSNTIPRIQIRSRCSQVSSCEKRQIEFPQEVREVVAKKFPVLH